MNLLRTLIGVYLGILMSTSALSQPTNPFTGKYQSVNTNGTLITEINQDHQLIRGTFLMDGVNYQIIATSEGNLFQGKIIDEPAGKFYNVTSELKGNELHFAITIPEIDNQEINILFIKQEFAAAEAAQTTTPTNTQPLNSKEKSPRLVGTWRHTEVLSSGYGGDAASLATDYFVQFKPNGECLSWVGSSAGGSQDVSLENLGNGEVTREEWYTEGNIVTFIDPTTREEVSLTFYAEEHRMMLKGSSSKVYERVD